MRSIILVSAGLVALAACAADGVTTNDAPSPDDGGERPPEPPTTDGGDAGSDAPDVERPLACGKSGFCETKLPASPSGEPLSLRSVWVVAADDVWSVSAEGFVVHWDGAAWTTVHRADHELYAVWATSTDVWVGGERGLLFHRGQDGAWARVETGHVKAIRGISGSGASDIWMGHDGAIDHFDGSKLTTYPLTSATLTFRTIFSREGFGTFAAYAEGCLDCGEDSTSQPILFELAPGAINEFNTALRQRGGFFPVSGVVTDAPDENKRILLFGFQKGFFRWDLDYLVFGPETPAPIIPEDLAGLTVADEDFQAYPPQPTMPAWQKSWDDVRVQVGVGTWVQWEGSTVLKRTIDMGYEFVPRTVFAIHGNGADMWVVGDGFALKGPSQ